jgi:hypothetical protein
MSRALIGVGGTGAKILESFMYLSIMGLPAAVELNEIHLRLVDSDTKNNNKKRLEKLITLYNDQGLYKMLSGFSNIDKGKNWIPAPIKHERLRDPDDSEQNNYNSPFFWDVGLNSLSTFGSMIADTNLGGGSTFLKMLYGNDDQNVPLIEGCHGKPRIGAITYEHYFKTDVQTKGDESFWKSLYGIALKQAISQDNGKIMFAGSLFGGTGASGIPTLAKCFYDEFLKSAQNCEIGIDFMLPYYTYDDTGVCKAQSSEFSLNSKLALRYYHDSRFLDSIENANPSVYLIGQLAKPMLRTDDTEADTRITEQENPALPAEIVAAFSAIHFFRQSIIKGKAIYIIETSGREGTLEAMPNIGFKPKGISLSSFKKDSLRKVSVESAIERLKLFSILWFALIKHSPTLETQGKPTQTPYNNSFWNIQNDRADKWDENLASIDIFCYSAIEWLSQLEANGLNLDHYRDIIYSIRITNDGEAIDSDISFNNESIKDYLKKIGEIGLKFNAKHRKYKNEIKNDYINLLYATMQVCCDIVKY